MPKSIDFIFTVIIGLIFIGIGLAAMNRSFVEWRIKLFNEWQGTETKITENTILYHKIVGMILAFFGLVLIVGWFLGIGLW